MVSGFLKQCDLHLGNSLEVIEKMHGDFLTVEF